MSWIASANKITEDMNRPPCYHHECAPVYTLEDILVAHICIRCDEALGPGFIPGTIVRDRLYDSLEKRRG